MRASDRANSHEERRTSMLNALTVDVEDYFHTEAMSVVTPRHRWDQMPTRVRENMRRLLDLFAAQDARGTFFFLGWVAERFPDVVRETVRLGHELGCHSYWHRPVYKLSPAEFREDTKRAKAVIEDAAGVPVLGYRAPSFSMIAGTEWATEILGELGFRFDSSVHPIRHDLYHNPNVPRQPHWTSSGAILELPVATVRLGNRNLPIGGGGYWRVMPYRYIRWGLRRFNQRESWPAVVYLHPWEIDPFQPRMRAGLKSRLRQYIGLNGAERKLVLLLSDFHFAPIAEVFGAVLAKQDRQGPVHGASWVRPETLSAPTHEAIPWKSPNRSGVR